MFQELSDKRLGWAKIRRVSELSQTSPSMLVLSGASEMETPIMSVTNLRTRWHVAFIQPFSTGYYAPYLVEALTFRRPWFRSVRYVRGSQGCSRNFWEAGYANMMSDCGVLPEHVPR